MKQYTIQGEYLVQKPHFEDEPAEYINRLPRYLISEELKVWLKDNPKEWYELGKDFWVVSWEDEPDNKKAVPIFSKPVEPVANKGDKKDFVVYGKSDEGKNVLASDNATINTRGDAPLFCGITDEQFGDVAEMCWTFLTEDAGEEHKMIAKKDFIHEVEIALSSIQDIIKKKFLSQHSGDEKGEVERLNKIILIKEAERAEWANMCIKKQETIEYLNERCAELDCDYKSLSECVSKISTMTKDEEIIKLINWTDFNLCANMK